MIAPLEEVKGSGKILSSGSRKLGSGASTDPKSEPSLLRWNYSESDSKQMDHPSNSEGSEDIYNYSNGLSGVLSGGTNREELDHALSNFLIIENGQRNRTDLH